MECPNCSVLRGRKRSWVGLSEEKPYSYLRETMVESLMNGICREETVGDASKKAKVSVSSEKRAEIADAVSQWDFCAHDLSDDELITAAIVMFEHALAMPELEPWRISEDELYSFIVACRGTYNDFVPYHNFRHVVDVLQATFSFLLNIGAIPRIKDFPSKPPKKSTLALLLSPFEALTLLITAIGHDVGHPGVNNGFLVTLNAPLAQLYNDRSVLESFHCAAFSQVLRHYWPRAFQDAKMRDLMIQSILATDMGLHFEYMKRMGHLKSMLERDGDIEGLDARMIDEQKALACALLIKCADISNVARKYDTAVQWMQVLSDEFSRQASMEMDLKIKSSLMAPPKKDAALLAKNQLGFMNIFAIPLFQGVADLLPAMQYCVDELAINKQRFETGVAGGEIKEDVAEQPLERDESTTTVESSTTVETAATVGSTLVVSESSLSQPELLKGHGCFLGEDDLGVQRCSKGGRNNCTDCEADKALGKRPSWFRLNALNIFRRHKTASPRIHAADAPG